MMKLGGNPVGQITVFMGDNPRNKCYKVYFEDDGFASMYETEDENGFEYEEAMRIVNCEVNYYEY